MNGKYFLVFMPWMTLIPLNGPTGWIEGISLRLAVVARWPVATPEVRDVPRDCGRTKLDSMILEYHDSAATERRAQLCARIPSLLAAT